MPNSTCRQLLPPLPSTYYRISKHHYKRLKVGNHNTFVYRTSDIAAIYGLHQNTVMNWYNKRMLPTPYNYYYTSYRSWGWERRPVWVKEQVLAICKVLDDIFAQGGAQFRKSHIEHIAIMRAGSDIAIKRLPYKAVKQKQKRIIIAKVLRKRPSPNMRPFLKALRTALSNHFNKRSKCGRKSVI